MNIAMPQDFYSSLLRAVGVGVQSLLIYKNLYSFYNENKGN